MGVFFCAKNIGRRDKMASDGTIEIDVDIDEKELKSGLSKLDSLVTKESKSIGSKLGSGISKGLSVAGSALTTIGTTASVAANVVNLVQN